MLHNFPHFTDLDTLVPLYKILQRQSYTDYKSSQMHNKYTHIIINCRQVLEHLLLYFDVFDVAHFVLALRTD